MKLISKLEYRSQFENMDEDYDEVFLLLERKELKDVAFATALIREQMNLEKVSVLHLFTHA